MKFICIDNDTPKGKLLSEIITLIEGYEKDLFHSTKKCHIKKINRRIYDNNIDTAIDMYKSREYSVKEIFVATGVTMSTIKKYI